MRKSNAVSEFKTRRDAELTRVFRRLLTGQPPSIADSVDDAEPPKLRELLALAARQPASRFWVSEERAGIVIRDRLLRGVSFDKMKPESRRMYEEILRRVVALREQRPDLSIAAAVREVIFSPAPEFYLSDNSARVLIYRRIHAEREVRRRRDDVLASIRSKTKQYARYD